MNRPYVICHMLQAKNGKVTGSFLSDPVAIEASNDYYEIQRNYMANAFACGRVTMEGSFTGSWYPDLSVYGDQKVERKDYKACNAEFYAIAFDRKGRLGWKENRIHDEDPGYNQAHIVEVLCEDLVSDAYLSYLREKQISYVFGGKAELDIKIVLEKLSKLFSIDLMLLEGGAVLNSAFEQSGCIDELSLVTADIIAVDGEGVLGDTAVTDYQLKDRYDLGNNVLYTTYQKKRK